jgi:carbamoyltransferase
MRDHLNRTVKHRESFRPFAPAVLTEHLDAWFEAGGAGPFMLSTTWVRQDRRSQIPAVTHVDGTARVQCVDPGDGLLRQIVEEFYLLTHVPMVLNTSFNGAGDPMVETPEDALQAFLNMRIDLLYLEGHAVRRDAPAP